VPRHAVNAPVKSCAPRTPASGARAQCACPACVLATTDALAGFAAPETTTPGEAGHDVLGGVPKRLAAEFPHREWRCRSRAHRGRARRAH